MACTPSGLEGFFEEASKAMMDKASPEQMNKIRHKTRCPIMRALFPHSAIRCRCSRF
jgi:hypothetical protein